MQLVTSDAHTGVKAAIDSILLGAAWQRCRIHAGRNLLAAVPKGNADMVAAAARTIFAQPDAASVRSQLTVIAAMLGRQFPKIETMLTEAADDLTAFADFPVEHWKKIWSTNGLERVNSYWVRGLTAMFSTGPERSSSSGPGKLLSNRSHHGWQASMRKLIRYANMFQ